jgi:hypothetical protein
MCHPDRLHTGQPEWSTCAASMHRPQCALRPNACPGCPGHPRCLPHPDPDHTHQPSLTARPRPDPSAAWAITASLTCSDDFRAVQGLVRQGADALTLLGESVSVLEHSALQVELARSLVELAASLLQAGRRAESAAMLRRALHIAGPAGRAHWSPGSRRNSAPAQPRRKYWWTSH